MEGIQNNSNWYRCAPTILQRNNIYYSSNIYVLVFDINSDPVEHNKSIHKFQRAKIVIKTADLKLIYLVKRQMPQCDNKVYEINGQSKEI